MKKKELNKIRKELEEGIGELEEGIKEVEEKDLTKEEIEDFDTFIDKDTKKDSPREIHKQHMEAIHELGMDPDMKSWLIQRQKERELEKKKKEEFEKKQASLRKKRKKKRRLKKKHQ